MQSKANISKSKDANTLSNAASSNMAIKAQTPSYTDNRLLSVAQKKLQELADNSNQVKQLKAYQTLLNSKVKNGDIQHSTSGITKSVQKPQTLPAKKPVQLNAFSGAGVIQYITHGESNSAQTMNRASLGSATAEALVRKIRKHIEVNPGVFQNVTKHKDMRRKIDEIRQDLNIPEPAGWKRALNNAEGLSEAPETIESVIADCPNNPIADGAYNVGRNYAVRAFNFKGELAHTSNKLSDNPRERLKDMRDAGATAQQLKEVVRLWGLD